MVFVLSFVKILVPYILGDNWLGGAEEGEGGLPQFMEAEILYMREIILNIITKFFI
jgi:hypothetical protein